MARNVPSEILERNPPLAAFAALDEETLRHTLREIDWIDRRMYPLRPSSEDVSSVTRLLLGLVTDAPPFHVEFKCHVFPDDFCPSYPFYIFSFEGAEAAVLRFSYAMDHDGGKFLLIETLQGVKSFDTGSFKNETGTHTFEAVLAVLIKLTDEMRNAGWKISILDGAGDKTPGVLKGRFFSQTKPNPADWLKVDLGALRQSVVTKELDFEKSYTRRLIEKMGLQVS